LVTLLAVSSLRSLAGFVSHRQRSWDSPFGASSSRKVSERLRSERPTYRFSHRYTPPEARPARQAAVPGFWPFRKSLATTACLARQPLAAPLGFTLLGLTAKALARISPDLLPRALGFHLAPRSFDQPSLRLIRPHGEPRGLDQPTLRGFSHRLDPIHSNTAPSELFDSLRAAPHIAVLYDTL